MPFSSSKYLYSWLRLSNLVDLSFEYLSFSKKKENNHTLSQSSHVSEMAYGKMRPRLGGLPYLADRATRLGGLPHLSCKHDEIKMRDYMERRVTPPRRVTSPTWGPPRPCKQALNGTNVEGILSFHVTSSFFKIKITNSSDVLVSSDRRASNNLTFYND